MTSPTVPDIALNSGRSIPQLGFGVFQIPPAETKEAVLAALEIGYRHIDTAEGYGNEKEVGEAVRESGIDRSEIFITSKLNNPFQAPDDAKAAFEGTIEAIGEYVDLFLIHWPNVDAEKHIGAWKVLEGFYADGRSRSIGVSNFQPHHLRRLDAETTVTPAVNQIEVHPYLTNDEVRAYGQEHGIVTEAWSPIAQGLVLEDPVLLRIAERLGTSTAQVVLRWHIQRGDVIFPKSVTRSRMEENFAIFDFELSPEDLSDVSALNRDHRTGPDPDTFNRA